MLLLMRAHGGVAHERVVAVGSRAVEMSIDLVVVAARESAVDTSIEEDEALHDVNIIVEVFGMQDKDVLTIGHIVASVLDAVKVSLAIKGTQLIWAWRVLGKDVEAVVDLHKKCFCFRNQCQVTSKRIECVHFKKCHRF